MVNIEFKYQLINNKTHLCLLFLNNLAEVQVHVKTYFIEYVISLSQFNRSFYNILSHSKKKKHC